MTALHFAQISDIHISVLGDHHDMMTGHADGFLQKIIAELGRIEDLDFVLITGDLLDTAHPAELERFQNILVSLKQPCYIIPGNHDISLKDDSLSRPLFTRYFNPQAEDRPHDPQIQSGYWSLAITPDVQLIGLDSIRTEDWGGVIDAVQQDWLEAELAAHTGRLVIVAVHHPLHRLAPIDTHPDWQNFVCSNGPQILALLDKHPQVKLVLSGHHHLTRADQLGGRLHLACPAVAGYPCAYRTIRLSRNSPDTWRIDWQTHPAADEPTVAEARHRMISAWQSISFSPDFTRQYADQALGREQDRSGSAVV